MADGSAAALAEMLLADDPAQSSESLVAVLSGDPSLVLWTVCVADREDAFEPRSVHDLARWLAQHALEVLRWKPDQDAHSDAALTADAEALAGRVAAAVQVAELAARLAAEQKKADKEANPPKKKRKPAAAASAGGK